ncbi:MAG TPA: hypothetical protein VK211_26100 [Kamptonema sp.]|nr:hypothetical protein [Kamptonema sp.]
MTRFSDRLVCLFITDNYDDVKMWLLEDEYQRLNSRILQEV